MPDFPSAVADFLDYCSDVKRLSAHSMAAYSQDGDELLAFTSRQPELSPQGYLRFLQVERKLAPASVKRRLAFAKSLCKWATREGRLNLNPFDNIECVVKLGRRLPKSLSANELSMLLKAIQAEGTWRSSACHLCVLLMCATGIRVGESVRIQLKDVETRERRIRIRGKGNRERIVYVVDDDAASEIGAYIRRERASAGSDELLLLNARGNPLTEHYFRRFLRGVSESSIGRRVTPHMLRHTAATMLVERGVDIRFIQRLLGHQSIQTTEIYTHVSDGALVTALRRADVLGAIARRQKDEISP